MFSRLMLMAVAGCTVVRPAEDGPLDMILLGTPTYENAVGRPSEPVQYEMISALLPSTAVGLVTNEAGERDAYAAVLEEDYGVDPILLDGLLDIPVPHTDLWFRDMGGVFVDVTADQGRTKAVVDFGFNGWGYGPFSDAISLGYYEIDDDVAAGLADHFGYPVIESAMVTEGGAFDSNGAGTTMYSLQALQQRNPAMSQEQIEAEFLRVLGATHLLALPVFHPLDRHAVLDGPLHLIEDGVTTTLFNPITVRHIDVVARFAGPGTILVAQLPQEDVRNNVEQEIHDTLQQAWYFFANQVDQDGQPFELVAFPDPGLILDHYSVGDVLWEYMVSLDPPIPEIDPAGGSIALPAEYINYVVSPTVILVATNAGPARNPRLVGADAEAAQILSDLYPGREVVQVDTTVLGIGGGGMHCITQEVSSL